MFYLFAALSQDPERRTPGGAEFLYATREGGKTDIARSGFLLDDADVRAAADTTADSRFTKKLLTPNTDEVRELMNEMRTAVCAVAERILSGEAHKTPSEKACRFCPVADWCDRAMTAKG